MSGHHARAALDAADVGEPSGERFIPETMGDQLMEAEHYVRYHVAARCVAAHDRVLDAGCGVGWGSEILAHAGAAAVTGIDIDAGAIESAKRHCRSADFAVGDLLELPFPSATFEVVTCFEAIEHVTDPSRALDEIRRVLTPDGIVLVSSPNPDVYPSGNPFHIHELRPTELLDAMLARFANAQLWRQYPLMASVLAPDGSPRPAADANLDAKFLSDLTPGHDTYSLVVASGGVLPPLSRAAVLVSTRQLDELHELAQGLATERARLDRDRHEILEERSSFMVDHERIAAERSRLLTQHAAALAEANRLTLEAKEHASALVEANRLALQAQDLRVALARMQAQRDHALFRLLEVEQQIASRPSPDAGASPRV
jgi:SAM-dependent methyltransferase